MSDMRGFSFGILQYRHDVWSGEALNVGLLLVCPDADFVGFECPHSLPTRVSAAYPDVLRADLAAAIRSIERSVKLLHREMSVPLLSDSSSIGAERIAEALFPNSDASLRFARFGSGITTDPKEELEHLYQRYVTRFDPKPTPRLRADEDVLKPVSEALAASGVGQLFHPQTIRSDLVSADFPCTYQNGVLHAVRPLSFDMREDDNIENKASVWSGKLMHLRKASIPFRPYFLIGRPSLQGHDAAFGRAVKMLEVASAEANSNAQIILDDDAHHLSDTLIEIAQRPH